MSVQMVTTVCNSLRGICRCHESNRDDVGSVNPDVEIRVYRFGMGRRLLNRPVNPNPVGTILDGYIVASVREAERDGDVSRKNGSRTTGRARFTMLVNVSGNTRKVVLRGKMLGFERIRGYFETAERI